MQSCFASPIPVYFLNIDKEADGYVCYVCKDTGRKKRINDVAFETYAEAKKFCSKKCPTLTVMTV